MASPEEKKGTYKKVFLAKVLACLAYFKVFRYFISLVAVYKKIKFLVVSFKCLENDQVIERPRPN